MTVKASISRSHILNDPKAVLLDLPSKSIQNEAGNMEEVKVVYPISSEIN